MDDTFERRKSRCKSLLRQILLIAIVFGLAARLSLSFDLNFNHIFASPFWPPTGIALYILLTRGHAVWPGIALGYFIGTFQSATFPFLVAEIGAMLAATSEVLLSYYLLIRINGGKLDLEWTRGLLSLIAIGAFLSPAIFSTVVIGTWYLIGNLEPNSFLIAWRTYFLADALSVILFTPLLLAIHDWKSAAPKKTFDGLEAFAILGLVTLTTLIVFTHSWPTLFLLFPLISWAALRFKVLGSSLSTLIVALIGGLMTVAGLGPLAHSELLTHLAFLQFYWGTLGVTGLLLASGAQIEARQRALAEVSAERKKFEIAARNASDLIYEANPKTGELLWLGRIDEALGYEPGEFPRTHAAWKSRLHPEDRERATKSFDKTVREKAKRTQEYRMIKKDGSIAYWKISAQRIIDEHTGEEKWIGAVHDLTEQHQVEAALRESEERYYLATTAAEVGVWDWDSQTNTTKWSAIVARHFGTGKTTLSGPDVLALVHPDDREKVLNFICESIAQGLSTFSQEFRVRRAEEKEYWLLSKGQFFYDSEGSLARATGTIQDITESKHMLQELHQARETAEKASRAKTEFLANMSHEIRTPMNAILGFANLLSEDSLQPDVRQDFIARIKANGDQLLALVDDILDLSKFEAGQIPTERLQFSLPDLISQTLLVLAPFAKKKGLTLLHEVITPIPQVITSDPTRLRQILTNLIGNSIKFTECGSIKLRLHFLQSPGQSKPCLRIDVEDTGIGIPTQVQAQLFRPFSQGDSSFTRKFGGTGLGLTLSKKLAEALGGQLKLTRSIPGQGSCFSFWIDPGDVSKTLFVRDLAETKEKHPSPPSRAQAVSPSPRLKDLKVLLVEDSPDNEALVKLYLSKDGAHCESAHDGLEAIEKAQASVYDVILMDVQMPNMDGLEATRRLRAMGFKKPIIALTAHALQSEARKSFESGCTAHLTKPISRAKLVEALTSVMAEAADTTETTPTITAKTSWFSI